MSHFVLIAALPADTDDVDLELAARLAPYDENKEVPAYKSYEDEERPEQHWYYRHLKERADAVLNQDHSIIKPYNPDTIGWSSAETRETPEEQWTEIVRDAERFNSLSDPVDWPSLINVYNAEYYSDPDEDSNNYYNRLRYDAEADRAFTWSTYNPDSKWDWYQVGGRWSYYFPARATITDTEYRGLIHGSGWPRNEIPLKPWHCEGGPKKFLDLEKLRDEKGKEAAEEYDKWTEFSSQYPPAQPWESFLAEFEDMPNGTEKWAVRDRVREVYRTQPLIAASNDHPDYRFAWECLVTKFTPSREEYIAAARRDAVPGFAVLTLDNEWVAPGKMGMFGFSDDTPEGRAEYKDWANQYLDGLDDDVILVAVDLHI